ncbi:MAG: RidA family protein [Limisphaerales bacterium]
MTSRSFFKCFAPFVAVVFSAWMAQANIESIQPDSATGTAKAVVVDRLPLAHTAQVFPVGKKGEVVAQGEIAKQTEQVLENLNTVLKKAKSDLGQVVKLNIYVANAELTEPVTRVLAKRFPGKQKPAVAFTGGELPMPGALVAMDAVAVSRLKTRGSAPVHFLDKDARHSLVTVLPPDGAVYLAVLATRGDLAPATRETMQKIEEAIAHLGLKRSDIVQLKAFLLPMSRVEEVKSVIAEFFGGETVPPVIYYEWMSGSVPIEIEAIAAAPASKAESTITYHTPTGITASPVYSRLARVHGGKRIYISGLYGTSEPEKDIKEIYEQLDALLERTGSSRDHMAKATYYFSDPKSNSRLDAFRPGYYNPKTPPTASKTRVKDVGQPGRGIAIDMIAITK